MIVVDVGKHLRFTVGVVWLVFIHSLHIEHVALICSGCLPPAQSVVRFPARLRVEVSLVTCL